MRRLVLRELRRQLPVALALVALCLLVALGAAPFGDALRRGVDMTPWHLAAVVVTLAAPWLLGVAAVAPDVESGAARFLAALPCSPARQQLARAAVAAGYAALLIAPLATLTREASGARPGEHVAGVALLFLSGLVASAVTGRTLAAFVAAPLLALVAFDQAGALGASWFADARWGGRWVVHAVAAFGLGAAALAAARAQAWPGGRALARAVVALGAVGLAAPALLATARAVDRATTASDDPLAHAIDWRAWSDPGGLLVARVHAGVWTAHDVVVLDRWTVHEKHGDVARRWTRRLPELPSAVVPSPDGDRLLVTVLDPTGDGGRGAWVRLLLSTRDGAAVGARATPFEAAHRLPAWHAPPLGWRDGVPFRARTDGAGFEPLVELDGAPPGPPTAEAGRVVAIPPETVPLGLSDAWALVGERSARGLDDAALAAAGLALARPLERLVLAPRAGAQAPVRALVPPSGVVLAATLAPGGRHVVGLRALPAAAAGPGARLATVAWVLDLARPGPWPEVLAVGDLDGAPRPARPVSIGLVAGAGGEVVVVEHLHEGQDDHDRPPSRHVVHLDGAGRVVQRALGRGAEPVARGRWLAFDALDGRRVAVDRAAGAQATLAPDEHLLDGPLAARLVAGGGGRPPVDLVARGFAPEPAR